MTPLLMSVPSFVFVRRRPVHVLPRCRLLRQRIATTAVRCATPEARRFLHVGQVQQLQREVGLCQRPVPWL